MTINQTTQDNSRKPLRVWPGVVFAIVLVIGRYLIPPMAPDAEIGPLPVPVIGVFAAIASALGIVIWWLFFSRAAWSERLGAIVLMIVAVFAMRPIVDESIRGGMMGNMLYVYSIPILAVALVAWAVATRRLVGSIRCLLLVTAVLLACVPFLLIRTAGVFGASAELHWRWTETPEDRLLARGPDQLEPLPPTPAPPAPAVAAQLPKAAPVTKPGDKPLEVTTASAAKVEAAVPVVTQKPAEWPGFRGPKRDSVISGVRISTDWSGSPPVQMWRRPIGPGWSSFAVRGDVFYTQEQRGEQEIVAAYKLSTGAPVWRHGDPVRFYESNGGPGPRATPTIQGDRVYAFGATGILNALDARTGSVVWSHNVSTDAKRQVPGWGFTSSPLIVDDVVIVAASGTLAGYDLATGKLRWVGRRQLGSYSSPQVATIDGVPQVILLSGSGAAAFAPATGELLWQHAWEADGAAIVQPAITSDGDILINSTSMMGGVAMRRISISHVSSKWTVEERWTSTGLKPFFNDFVVHKGHAYGFDGSILACIDLQDGARKWKGGRYGSGQLVLLADQDVLLVVSEDGELALVSATPDQYKELARIPGIEGKTWNHPVLIRNVLLVRNGEEMAAFRLSLGGREETTALAAPNEKASQ